jgi:hypothetical protein
MSAKHRSKFAAQSSVMMTAAEKLENCSGGYKQDKQKKQKQNQYLENPLLDGHQT